MVYSSLICFNSIVSSFFPLSIHPRDKQDVAYRLMRGALNVAYGHSDVTYKGPFPSQFHVTGSGAQRTVTIQYDNGRASLSIRDTKGFEVRDARELRNVSLVTTPTSFPLYLLRSECTMRGLIEPMANCQAAHVTTMN